MDDAPQAVAGEIEVSPEEKRFLARFFRRQILPWAGALLVISAAISLGFGGDDTREAEARTSSAVAQLRAENQKLRDEIERLSARVEADVSAKDSSSGNELERRIEDAKHNVRMIEARITAKLERRLDGLEAQLTDGVAAAPVSAGGSGVAPPPDASAWDVSQILDRLYAVEMSQQKRGTSAPNTAQLRALEARLSRLETPSTPPAELAP